MQEYKEENMKLYYTFRITEFDGIGILPMVVKDTDYSQSMKNGSVVKITDANIINDVKQYINGELPLPDYLEETKPLEEDDINDFMDKQYELLFNSGIDPEEFDGTTLPICILEIVEA